MIADVANVRRGLLIERMSNGLRLVLVMILAGSSLTAHDIITTKLTYTRDISRLFERKCVACHGAGASIPLTTYEEVRPWAVGIKEQVLSRAMPPWGAVKGFGNLAHDGALTQEEMMIIAAWVIGGAPAGDPSLLPKASNAANPAAKPLKNVITINTRGELQASITLWGIRPEGGQPVASARIIAKLPDGRIEPIVWLYQFDPKSHGGFELREGLALPARTTIEASSPVVYTLETTRQ